MNQALIQGTGQSIVQHLKDGDVRWIEQLSAALPEHVKPDRMVRVLLTAFARVPALATCSQASVWQSIMDCCALGLEPDALGRAYLLPYKVKGVMTCQLQIGYKGLIDLAMRSGKVKSIHADKVAEKDLFEYSLGNDAVLKHQPYLKGSRGDAYCYYAYCHGNDGSFSCDVMTMDEVLAIKARSKTSNFGPWVTDFDEMAKKTVIKRLSKTLPLSPEFVDAIGHDNKVNALKDIRDGGQVEARTFTIPEEKPLTAMELVDAAKDENEAEQAFADEMNKEQGEG